MVKPIDSKELMTRIQSLLQGTDPQGTDPQGRVSERKLILQWEKLRLDPHAKEITYNGQLLSLTSKEYSFLELLLRNNQRVFSDSSILEHLWGYEDIPGAEAVRAIVRQVRQKLKAAGAPPDVIETVYGIGYRLKFITSSLVSEPSAPEFWQHYQTQVIEQIALLEQAINNLLDDSSNEQLLQQTDREAHKLAGYLDALGFLESSQVVQKIETLLNSEHPLESIQIQQIQQMLITALHQEFTASPVENSEVDVKRIADDPRPLLLVIDRDRDLSESLVQEAANWGLQGAIATNLVKARDLLYRCHPSLVLLDLDLLSNLENSLLLLDELSQNLPQIPVIIFTAQNSLAERLAVARKGARIFLQKPLPITQVLTTITQVLHPTNQSNTKVLIVDDDPAILSVLKTLLEPWGLQMTLLNDPRNFGSTV
jgi:DNA-binding response OmpR family regulator